jgi:RND family efflux transporter MFP subunit
MNPLNENLTSKTTGKRIVHIAVPLLVIVIGIVIAVSLVKTGPKASRKPPVKQARLVEVTPLSMGTVTTEIEAMGTVVPARKVELHPQVSGEIIKVSEQYVPGGLFRAGDEILQIDPKDYVLAVKRRESEVAQAMSNVKIEQGQQIIAQRELEMIGEAIDEKNNDLILRKPQLESVQAQLSLAQATLEQARLDLQRTRIHAPFNSIVISRSANIGSRVLNSTLLATLVGTDQYWIEVAVPVDQLKWIRIPGPGIDSGSSARIYNDNVWRDGEYREGKIMQLVGDLESEGRMARLLIAVEDPLDLDGKDGRKPRLLIDSYVRVIIDGTPQKSVISIDRKHVHDGNLVWIMDEQDRLNIRTVSILFRGKSNVLVTSGVKAGERLVTTDLSAPVNNMPLRLEDEASSQSRPAREMAK